MALSFRRASTNPAPAPLPEITPETPVPYAQFVALANTLADMHETVKSIRKELVDTRASLVEVRQLAEDQSRKLARMDETARRAMQETAAIARTHTSASVAQQDLTRAFARAVDASVNGPVAVSAEAIMSGEQGIAYIASKMGQNRRTIGKRLAESDAFAPLRAACEKHGLKLTTHVHVLRWLASQPDQDTVEAALGRDARNEPRYALIARGAVSIADMKALDALAKEAA